MDVSTIVVSYNTAHLLPEMMGKLEAASNGLAVETIIIDNASSDTSVDLIRAQFADCTLIVNPSNVGFGRANNQALPLIRGEFVLLLNTDAFVCPNSLAQTVAYMRANPKSGILGVKLAGRDGQLQPSARFFPTPWNAFVHRAGLQKYFKGTGMVDSENWNHQSAMQCDWVPGCYFLIRKTVIDQVGLFDPRYFLYFEEVDLCFAAKKAGWDVVSFPDVTVVHIGGESAKSDGAITKSGRQLQALQIESELLYFRKNHGAATVLADVVLSSLADLLCVFKQFFKTKNQQAMSSYFQHTSLMWTLFVRTRWGSTPTR